MSSRPWSTRCFFTSSATRTACTQGGNGRRVHVDGKADWCRAKPPSKPGREPCRCGDGHPQPGVRAWARINAAPEAHRHALCAPSHTRAAPHLVLRQRDDGEHARQQEARQDVVVLQLGAQPHLDLHKVVVRRGRAGSSHAASARQPNHQACPCFWCSLLRLHPCRLLRRLPRQLLLAAHAIGRVALRRHLAASSDPQRAGGARHRQRDASASTAGALGLLILLLLPRVLDRARRPAVRSLAQRTSVRLSQASTADGTSGAWEGICTLGVRAWQKVARGCQIGDAGRSMPPTMPPLGQNMRAYFCKERPHSSTVRIHCITSD